MILKEHTTHLSGGLNYFQISTNAVQIRAKTAESVLMEWTNFRVPVLQVTMETIVETVSLILTEVNFDSLAFETKLKL